MEKLTKNALHFLFTTGIAGLVFCTASQMTVSTAESVKEGSTYQEIENNGRIYVFASPARKADFEKSGELGKGIIKIGYGRNGETVVFDSEDAVIQYEAGLVKEILGKANIKAYREAKINDRLYVFTSPTRKENFEKSGELGVSIIKIGYGPNGETVVFDSDEAVKEYDNRHPQKHVQK